MFKNNKKKISSGVALALIAGALPATVFAAPAHQHVIAQKVDGAIQVTQAAKAFADLPTDHWAFDAVEQLAHDGILVGYEDGLFKGERQATRYEVAQIVARAMAVENRANEQDRQLIHRLAVEFANELDNLGVRVSALEKKVDNVKWNGELRYNIQNRDETNQRDSALELRLEPTAQVNDNFAVKARVTASVDEDNSDMKLKLDRAYADINYDKMPLNVQLGQVGFVDDSGLVFDDDYDSYRGGHLTFGNVLRVTAGGGRWEGRNVLGGEYDADGTAKDVVSQKLAKDADYQFVGAQYDNGKLFGGAAFHHLKSTDLATANEATNRANDKGETDIWTVNAGYRVNDAVTVKAAYAKNEKASVGDESKSVQIGYDKFADQTKKNAWGLYAAYKDLGANTTFSPSGFGVEKLAGEGVKGYQFGATYTPWNNVMVTGSYFTGDNVKADGSKSSTNSVEGRVNFFF